MLLLLMRARNSTRLVRSSAVISAIETSVILARIVNFLMKLDPPLVTQSLEDDDDEERVQLQTRDFVSLSVMETLVSTGTSADSNMVRTTSEIWLQNANLQGCATNGVTKANANTGMIAVSLMMRLRLPMAAMRRMLRMTMEETKWMKHKKIRIRLGCSLNSCFLKR